MDTQELRVSEIIDSGVPLSWQEALALVQAITAAVTASPCAPVTAPGTLEDFIVREPGDVGIAPERMPAVSVSELALFLGQLLPTESSEPETRTPAGIRFTIARALGMAEAPPIVSVAQFSKTLARFEQQERASLLAALFRRHRKQAATSTAERRRTQPSAATLRELLREADERAYAAVRELSVVRPDDRAAAPTSDMFRRFLREADIRNFELSQAPRRRPSPPPTGKLWRRRRIHAGLGLLAMVASGAIIGMPAVRETINGALIPTPGRALLTSSPFAARPRASKTTVVPGQMHLKPVALIPMPARSASTSARPLSAARHEEAATSVDRVVPTTGTDATGGAMVESLDVENHPVFSPSFSADGSAVFFDTREGGGSAVMEARSDRPADARSRSADDLRVVSVVNDGARNYHPHLSPDGRTLAFDSDRGGERGVYLADRDGRHVRRVSGAGYAAVPTWSPNGSELAYIKAEPDRPKVWNVWLLDLTTGASRRLTDYRYGQPWGASWFPDGRRICFAHEDHLVVLNLVTGEMRDYPSPQRGRLVRTPAVSPDGEHIVFQLYRDGAWLMDVRDGTMRRILDDPSAEEFAWTPDGRQVAFHSRRSGEWGVWFMTPQQ